MSYCALCLFRCLDEMRLSKQLMEMQGRRLLALHAQLSSQQLKFAWLPSVTPVSVHVLKSMIQGPHCNLTLALHRLQEGAAALRARLGRPALHPAGAVSAKRADLSAVRLAAARVTLEGLHEDRREREARLRSMLDLCALHPVSHSGRMGILCSYSPKLTLCLVPWIQPGVQPCSQTLMQPAPDRAKPGSLHGTTTDARRLNYTISVHHVDEHAGRPKATNDVSSQYVSQSVCVCAGFTWRARSWARISMQPSLTCTPASQTCGVFVSRVPAALHAVLTALHRICMRGLAYRAVDARRKHAVM